MKYDIVDYSHNKVSEISLSDDVFGIIPREDIVHRVIIWQLAKRRAGTHSTKTRAEVMHSTRKPFKQKGTGRARQGMKGVSQMRGGGVVFGPKPRTYGGRLNKKVKKLGLSSILSSKAKEGKLYILDDIELKSHKTKDFINTLSSNSIKNALFVGLNVDSCVNLNMACANIPNVDFLPICGLNVYDIVRHDTLYIHKDAVNAILERFL